MFRRSRRTVCLSYPPPHVFFVSFAPFFPHFCLQLMKQYVPTVAVKPLRELTYWLTRSFQGFYPPHTCCVGKVNTAAKWLRELLTFRFLPCRVTCINLIIYWLLYLCTNLIMYFSLPCNMISCLQMPTCSLKGENKHNLEKRGLSPLPDNMLRYNPGVLSRIMPAWSMILKQNGDD